MWSNESDLRERYLKDVAVLLLMLFLTYGLSNAMAGGVTRVANIIFCSIWLVMSTVGLVIRTRGRTICRRLHALEQIQLAHGHRLESDEAVGEWERCARLQGWKMRDHASVATISAVLLTSYFTGIVS